MKHTLLALFASFCAIVSSGCGNRSEVIATVNGETITADEFVQYLKTKGRVRIVTDQGLAEATVADTLAFQALEDLVTRTLVTQLAKDEGAFPDEKATLSELEFRKKLNPNFIQQLTNRGYTLERVKEELRLELATENLLTKGIELSDNEVDRYIKENKLDREPATADLLWILVKNDESKAIVDGELRSGQSFANVALRYSEAPDAKMRGGRFQERVLPRFPEPLRTQISNSPEGRTLDWVRAFDGWAKFYIERKTPERAATIDPARRELLKRELTKIEGRKARDIGKRLAAKLFESEKSIVVQPRELQDMWKQALERAKRERKVEVPAATGQPGAGVQGTP